VLKTGFMKGDTIVEVMFAVAVFSLVAVGTISIMNLGTSNSLQALQTTAARQAIDAEVAALQLMHDSFVAQYNAASAASDYIGAGATWANQIGLNPVASPGPLVLASATTPTKVIGQATCPAAPSKAFVLDPQTTTSYTGATRLKQVSSSTAPYPQLVYTNTGAFNYALGIWVQAQAHAGIGSAPGYVDFYVNACWPSPSNKNAMTLGTIVRLYVPA